MSILGSSWGCDFCDDIGGKLLKRGGVFTSLEEEELAVVDGMELLLLIILLLLFLLFVILSRGRNK